MNMAYDPEGLKAYRAAYSRKPGLWPWALVFLALILITATIFYSFGGNATKRSEQLYQAGLAQVQSGDFDTALAMFSEALQADPNHRGVRESTADLLQKMGQSDKAEKLYLDLIVLDPASVSPHLNIARIALKKYDTDEAARQAAEILRLDPSNIEGAAILAEVKYWISTSNKDAAGVNEAAAAARVILTDHPDIIEARRVVVRYVSQGPTPGDALPDLEIAIAQEPDFLELEEIKLGIFSKLGDAAGGLTQLQHMHEKFPENKDIQAWLLNALVASRDTEGAIDLLRSVAEAEGDDPAPRLAVVDFIEKNKGPDAALAELKRYAVKASATPSGMFFATRAASKEFAMGRAASAIALLKQALSKAAPSDQIHVAQVTLAEMLHSSGDLSGAAALIDAVLAEDRSNPDALAMKGVSLFDAGKFDEAAAVLSLALDQNAKDPKILVQLAQAQEKLGDTALAGKNFALAVEASHAGAEESLKFIQFLMRTDRPNIADIVLQSAVASSPGDVPLLQGAFDTVMSSGDVARAKQIVTLLKAIDTDEGRAATAQAEALLAKQN